MATAGRRVGDVAVGGAVRRSGLTASTSASGLPVAQPSICTAFHSSESSRRDVRPSNRTARLLFLSPVSCLQLRLAARQGPQHLVHAFG